MTKKRILTNATFVTDGDRPARAVAVVGERITSVGDLADIRDEIGAGAELVDLDGGTAFPGFSDNHVHVLNFGRSRMGVPCWPSDVKSVSEIIEKVRRANIEAPAGKWIRGRGYDPSRLVERRAPTASELDLEGGRCVVLDSFDFHRRVANHAALKAAGIGPETPDPADGEIIRDSQGIPTGELVDGARALLDPVMPPWSDEEDEKAIQIATDHFLSLGFTYLTNAAPLTMSRRGEEVAAFLRLSQRGDLRMRFTSMIRAELLTEAAELGLQPGVGDRNFQLGGAKVFADGALGTRTAFVADPYADGDNHGSMRIDLEQLESVIQSGSTVGWEVCVHAQGDRAVGLVADLMAKYPAQRKGFSHRIEHCSLTSQATIVTMAASRIVPVPQLGFLRYRSADFVSALGEERAARLYPLRSWIDAGLKPIHSSDSPVISDARPLAAVATAITRKDAEGNVWGADESISFAEALAMTTTWAAEAAGSPQDRGRIRPGFLADLTVFDGDPQSATADHLLDISPQMTIVGGDIVWRAR